MFDYAIASEKGPRKENEDAVGVWALSEGRLGLAVADGLGGHIGGKLASRLAIEMFRVAIDRPDSPNLFDVAKGIHIALKAAQEKSPELRNMATTFTAAIIEENQMYFVHCGILG